MLESATMSIYFMATCLYHARGIVNTKYAVPVPIEKPLLQHTNLQHPQSMTFFFNYCILLR